MITGISYVHLIAVACAFRLIIACTASNVPSAASVTSYATVTIVDASSPAAAAAATSDWEPRMIVNSVHPLTTNNLATADTLSERPMDSGAAYNAYYNGAQYNYSDSSEQGLGHYASHPNNQSYVAHFTDAYRQTASNNLMPVSPNHIMSRINVQPLQNEVTTKPNIFNTPYMNTFREIRSTVVTIFQRVQEFVSYMFNFFTIDSSNAIEGRGKKFKIKKKYKKFLLPLLIAYKLKFFALIPIIIGGLVLLVGSTGMAGFFFALFTAVISLNKSHH